MVQLRDSFVKGNAAEDGKKFNGWFVGDIESWCKKDKREFDPAEYSLRNTTLLEMKWGEHKRGDTKPKPWTKDSSSFAISILIKGKFLIQFRNKADEECEVVKLRKRGDYVLWDEVLEHDWKALKKSVILTVRWPKKKSSANGDGNDS